MSNRLKKIRNIVYRLKRAFGVTVRIWRPTVQTQNITTGSVSKTYQKITIKRAIAPPQRITREFTYDLSFIAANKNFTYGGLYDVGTQIFIIDKKDLPVAFEPNQNDFVIWNTEQYEISEVVATAEKRGFLLIAKKSTATPVVAESGS